MPNLNRVHQLYEAAEKQLPSITDGEVAQCWELLLQAIGTIRQGYGNTGGVITLSDMQRLITLIGSNVEWTPEGIGEDLFYITRMPGGRLEVQLVRTTETCDAENMLAELQKLWKTVEAAAGSTNDIP